MVAPDDDRGFVAGEADGDALVAEEQERRSPRSVAGIGWRWWNERVRRWCAVSLLLVYGLLVGMPLLLMARGPESRLPACCRRDGKHHCANSTAAMTAAMAGMNGGTDGGPRWVAAVERCPMFPAAVTPVRGVGFDAVLGAQPGFAVAVCHPASVVQASSRRRVARERSRHKRGPPKAPLLA